MNKRGVVLVWTLCLLAILTTLGIAYGARIFNEHAVMLKTVYSTQAFWISEAGIQKASWDYDQNQCHGMTNQADGTSCLSCSSCGSGPRLFTGSLSGGDFSVVYDPDEKTYVSTGSAYRGTGANRQLIASRKIKVMFGRDYIFGYAAFAQGAMTIGNRSSVDSYNSSTGLYNAATSGNKGNMGTNGSFVDVVDIGNNAVIKGIVSTGPGGTVDYMPSKVIITGGITHTNDIYLEPVTVPADLLSAVYEGNVTVSGTKDFSTGVYQLDRITIGNNGTININGDVEIYLTDPVTSLTTGNNTVAFNINDGGSLKIYAEGKIDFGNKVVISNNNPNKPPSSFMIFSLYHDEDDPDGVVISNINEFYGAVYAPLTNVRISNNAAFFGSAVGKEITLSNNGMMHYDEALSLITAPWQPLKPRDWQEQFD